MLRTIVCCAILLLLCPTTFAESPAEVEAAREAAQRHNESVESAEQRLEREIARAKADHANAVMKAKERMIEDLRRAFRTAMRSDAPENSIKIADQIKRLEKQIASLQKQAQPEPEETEQPEVKLKGLDPRLVGVVYPHGIGGTGNPHGRAYAITPEGKVRVLYDLDGKTPGIDIGSLYQGKIVNGELIVHFSDWTVKGFSSGRMQGLKIADNGQLRVRHGKFEDFQRGLFLTFDTRYEDAYFKSVEAFKAFIRGDNDDRDEDKPAERPQVVDVPEDVPVDPEGEAPDTVDADQPVDFFGIPIK